MHYPINTHRHPRGWYKMPPFHRRENEAWRGVRLPGLQIEMQSECPFCALMLSSALSALAPPPTRAWGIGREGIVRQGLLLPNPGQIQSSTLAGGRQAPNSIGKGWQTARRGKDRQKIRFKKKKRCPCVLPKFSGCKYCSHWLLYSASWWRCEDASIS